MVDLGSAAGVEDATGVEHEVAVGINGDRNNGDADGGGELLLVIDGDVSEARELKDTLAILNLACLVLSNIGVIGLSLHEVGLGVIEAVVHPTTIAALVAKAGGAVNKLLLGEGDELASLLEVSTFHGSDG